MSESEVTPASAPGAPPALLDAALEQLRLEGAIFFRSELTESFALESSPNDVAGVLHPGAERVILFHIVARGSCWVSALDGQRHQAREGDVIVVPYGDPHLLEGDDPAERVPLLTLLDPPPWPELPVVHHGGGGPCTSLVCGYLYCDDPLFDPAMRALPPVFVVRLEGRAVEWVRASVAYALEESSPRNGGPPNPLATRLPELVFVEVLRAHLAHAPAADHGWISALHDPVLAPTLSRIHNEPERRWTVADLAAGAAVSRSVLDERFRRTLGRSPIRYLTEWRMHLADELLATTDLAIVAIAHTVGYESEEAFSRAFKRARGCSPSHWRAARSDASLPSP